MREIQALPRRNSVFFFHLSDTPGFAPGSQLFKRSTGALHCTGTVARRLPGGYPRYPIRFSSSQGRQNYKKYNSKSGAL